MTTPIARDPLDRGYRFPPEIIGYAVWLYIRFHLSRRDIEDLLAERGVQVSYEAIRLWCRTFGPVCAAGLRQRRARAGDRWHLDEVQLKINGKRHWLWGAVDRDGLVLDILVQHDGISTRRKPPCSGCWMGQMVWPRGWSSPISWPATCRR